MTGLSLSQPKPGCWQLVGDVTSHSLSSEYRKLCRQRPTSGAWQIDASQIDKFDSATLAFFLDSIRYSQQNKLTLVLMQIPVGLKNLMRAQGVETLITPYVKGKK